jgi:aspartate-semialdehyde dehydrogenase
VLLWQDNSDSMGRDDEDGMADQEERMINEEYKIWKKNTPFLYGECTDIPRGYARRRIATAPARRCVNICLHA